MNACEAGEWTPRGSCAAMVAKAGAGIHIISECAGWYLRVYTLVWILRRKASPLVHRWWRNAVGRSPTALGLTSNHHLSIHPLLSDAILFNPQPLENPTKHGKALGAAVMGIVVCASFHSAVLCVCVICGGRPVTHLPVVASTPYHR